MKPGVTFDTELEERCTDIGQVKNVEATDATETHYTCVTSFLNPNVGGGELHFDEYT